MNLKEGLKTIAEIAAKTTIKWLITVVIGAIFTLFLFAINLFQSVHRSENETFVEFTKHLFKGNTFAFIIVFGMPVFIILYVLLANKTAIQSIIYEVWKSKANEFILLRLQRVIEKITNNSDTVSSFSDATVLRMRLIDANRNDVEQAPVQRRVLNYLFKKINLSSIDFRDENVRLSDVIINQINRFVTALARPSFKLFFLLLFIQFLVFVAGEVVYIFFW